MGSDFYFRMGSTHAICQDYCLAGQGYAILADGCSGKPIPGRPGSPYTDFGARFLVRSAEMAIWGNPTFWGEDMLRGIIYRAHDMAIACGLPNVCLDGTLLIATVDEQNVVRVRHIGDGTSAFKARDGSISYVNLKFDQNAPHYLSYMLDPQAELRYQSLVKSVTVTKNTFDPKTGWGTPEEVVHPLEDFYIMQNIGWVNPELTLIMSDGAESFQTKTGSLIPLESVLDELFAIKSYPGEFLVRRCNRFLKTVSDKGWQHTDDFSVAGIYLEAST